MQRGGGEVSPGAEALARRLLERHREVDARFLVGKDIPATIGRWALDIDKIMRLDGRTEAEVERVIDWCQRDQFWRSNILSGGTLRKQFDRLVAKSGTASGQPSEDWNSYFLNTKQ